MRRALSLPCLLDRWFRQRGLLRRPGVFYAYISSTFLNGWINYTGLVKRAWLVTRYREHVDNVAALTKWQADPPFHADLSKLGDDVHLLTKDETGGWWYFWYDKDCSDCAIARFKTEDGDATVLDTFDEFVRAAQGKKGMQQIEVNTIKGWVSG